MSLFDCLETAIGAGEIQADKARVAQELFEELQSRYVREMDPEAAAALAGRDTKKIIRERIESRRHAVAAQILAARRMDTNLDAHTDFKGRNDMADAVPQLLKHRGTSEFESVSAMSDAIRRSLVRNLDQFVEKHSKDLIGRTRAKADLEKVRIELEGRSSGDPVSAAFARGLKDAYEQARLMFNAAGGHIQKLDNWAPQAWNRHVVGRISENEFIDDMIEAIDWTKVHDPMTGTPFNTPSGPRVREFLRQSRESIVSDGWNKVEPAFTVGGKAMYNRRADHRVLHFKPGEWVKVAQKYGSPDLFDASLGYLNSMARDIALMRVLGPNPRAGLEFAAQKALKQANTGASPVKGNAISHAQTQVNRARNMLAIASGASNTPVNEFWSSFFAGTRDFLTAAYLGSAIVSSVTDTVTLSFAANFVGMSGSRVLGRSARNLVSGRSIADMKRTVGVLETALNTSAAMARFSNDIMGPELTRRLAMGVIRAQGLGIWTDIHRNSFQMEFMGFLAENAGKSFDDLPAPLHRLLKQRGIKPGEWDTIRATPLFRGGTGEFLVPDDIRHRTDMTPEAAEGLALRLQSIIEEQTEFAVPTSDLEGKAMFLGSTQPGTFQGELFRSGLMFRNFGVSVMLGQIRRVQGIETAGGKAAYAASFITAMTIMGALAIQLKEAVKGRDPRAMDSPTFWASAAVQGGGFGVFGDFFASGTNRFGGGFAETLGGPVVGISQDIFDLTVGNAIQVGRGDDPRLGRDFTNLVRHNLPGGSLFFLRAPLERMVFDQLQQVLDPDASDYFRRQARRQRTEHGSRSFWDRGDLLPSRAPDLSTAIGR